MTLRGRAENLQWLPTTQSNIDSLPERTPKATLPRIRPLHYEIFCVPFGEGATAPPKVLTFTSIGDKKNGTKSNLRTPVAEAYFGTSVSVLFASTLLNCMGKLFPE
jgi:hypothetical protein